jgi:putative alpha-1,2-mannosidase
MPRYSWFVLLAQFLIEGTIPVFGQNTSTDIFQYIDPLIGTTNGGHVFPGATLPFGMAKAVPDVNSGERQGGYASDDGESKDTA